MTNRGVIISKKLIEETLATTPVTGKKLLEPLRSFAREHGLPINVLENSEVLDNDAEVHTNESDLWLALEGTTTFVYGGELVDPWVKKNADGTTDPRETKAKTISGGTVVDLTPGDWLWIPAGLPHQHHCAATSRLAIIKIPKV